MPQEQQSDPIERELLKLREELRSEFGDELTVFQAVARMLGFDESEATQRLLSRQLADADENVDYYASKVGTQRGAALGVGFVAGVSCAVAARRARQHADCDHELDDAGTRALLQELERGARHDDQGDAGVRSSSESEGPVMTVGDRQR